MLKKQVTLILAASLILPFTDVPVHAAQNTNTNSAKQRVASSTEKRHLSFSDVGQEYSAFKDYLQKQYGFGYSMTSSFTMQYGSPSGRQASLQTILYPSFVWTMFNNDKGNLNLNFAYNIVQYSGVNAETIDNRIGVVTAINDYTEQQNEFPELYFNYQFPNEYQTLSLGLGQYPLYNFDGTNYDANQQENFINWTFSQNASSTYPTAGLGSFVQIAPSDKWSIAAGFQDATNVDGNRISTSHLGRKHYTTFGYAAYTPTLNKLGAGQYSFLYYNQPWVEAQPQTTNGWSLNAQQNIGEQWAVFGRINGVSGHQADINRSYLLGAVLNNPFKRNPLDQIGFAAAVNHIDETAVGESLEHDYEKVLESYITFGVSKWAAITPDIQIYFNPALNPKSDNAFAFSLRASVFF
jgi:hypothetical protein